MTTPPEAGSEPSPQIRPAWTPRRLLNLDDDTFRTLMAILIALVSVLSAIVGLLLFDASTLSDQAKRNAQTLNLQASGLRGSGEARAGFDWYEAYYLWTELDLLARLATDRGDTAAARGYTEARDWIQGASPLLGPEYFDPVTRSKPNRAARRADLYLVDAITLEESAAATTALADALDSKERDHITQLSLLSLVLALHGLAATMPRRVRWIFAGTGTMLLIGALGSIAAVVSRPEPRLPVTAIEAYARGQGHAEQREWYGALAAYDEALAIAPGYASALYEKARTLDEIGDYAGAAENARAAWEAGKQHSFTAWNIGWWSYMLGRYDDAVEWDDRALEQEPTLLEVRANKGLALFAADRPIAARATYRDLMDRAIRGVAEARAAGQEPPSSFWIALDHATSDLQNLVDRLTGRDRPWTIAPPVDRVSRNPALAPIINDLIREIDELSIALEYTSLPPGPPLTATTESPTFAGQGQTPPGGTPVFPDGTRAVDVRIPFQGLANGQSLIVKILRDGAEEENLRIVSRWAAGSAGTATIPIRSPYGLAPGAYRVEVYVDSRRLTTGEFAIGQALH